MADQSFDQWFRSLPWHQEFQQRYGEPPNPNDPNYDYRAAFREGVTPQRYAPDGGAYHWPSVAPSGAPLKGQNHPTAWAEQFMQQSGGRDPFAMGVRTPEAGTMTLLDLFGLGR
jgi:hypothetical protein